MRYVFAFMCVLALGLMGCSDSEGTGGSGGDGGMGGDGGTGGITGQEFPCTEQGIRDAIAEGGGPHTFACDGPQTVVPEAFIFIDNDVILDGGGNLTVDGDCASDLLVVRKGVTAELSGFTVTRAGCAGCIEIDNWCAGIGNGGILKLTDVTFTDSLIGVVSIGVLTMANATVSDNAVGVLIVGGPTTLTNSTVSGNTGLAPFAGAIDIAGGGTVTLTNCTVSGDIGNSGSTLTLAASLVDGSCGGDITSNGYNIESPGDTCGFDQPTDQVNVTAEQLNLGELADNGGPTMTHALLTEPVVSVAIDQILEADCVDADGQPLTTDQRGEPRPETGGTMCDVGAFEVQP